MAFTLEDGTGVTNSNALISVAEFDAFLTDRNIPTFDWLEDEKKAAIVTASVDYIDTFFKFKGTQTKTTQGMQLPTDKVAINASIKRACAQASLLHLKKRLFVDPTSIDVKGQVVSERDKLDVLETEKTYKEGGAYTHKFPTTSIDRILSAYTIGGGLGSSLRW